MHFVTVSPTRCCIKVHVLGGWGCGQLRGRCCRRYQVRRPGEERRVRTPAPLSPQHRSLHPAQWSRPPPLHHKLGAPQMSASSIPASRSAVGGITHLGRVASAQAQASPSKEPQGLLTGWLSSLPPPRVALICAAIPSPGAPLARHDSLSCLLHKICRDPALQPVTPALASHLPPKPCSLSSPWLDTSSRQCVCGGPCTQLFV